MVYFGKDIFHKVNRVASLGQTFFKVVNISSSNNALEEFVRRILSPSPLTKTLFVVVG